jgi:hypothetical protein
LRSSLIFNNLNHIKMETYILVSWPECQQYMEEQWFYDEAILAVGAEEKVGTSAYFIPERRCSLPGFLVNWL